MISKLTKEQKNKLKEYKDKYIKIGLNTDRINKEQCVKDMNGLYIEILKRDKPRKVIICQSPYQLWHMLSLFSVSVKIIKNKLKNKKYNINEVENEVWKEVWKEVRYEVWKEVGEEGRYEVENEVWKEVGEEVRYEVEKEVWKEVRSEVRYEVGSEVRNEVWKEVRNEVENEVWKEVWKEVRNEVENEVGEEVRYEVENEVWKEVENEVRSEVRYEVGSEVRYEVGSEVGEEVENEVWNEVWKEVRYEVGSEVEKEVWKEVENEVWNKKNNYLLCFIFPYLYGNYDVYYFSFYSYMRDILKVKYEKLKKYNIYENTQNYGLIYPLKNICFVSEKPIRINRLNQKLHADYNPALLYEDGFCLWRLNGVKVPKWIVMTKPENMDANKIMAIKNVEVRREAIRKIGNALLFEKLDYKILDETKIYVDKNTRKVYTKSGKNRTKIDYVLIEVELGLREKAKVLKMRNPSLKDVYHYEFVKPGCKTVMDAFEFRNGSVELPLYLS